MYRHVILLILAASCGKAEQRTSLADFSARNASKIEALKTTLARAATALGGAAAPESGCKDLDLRLNGKTAAGTTEIMWADEVADLAAGKLSNAAEDPHLVATVDLAGWCQLIGVTMYWLRNDVKTDLNRDGIGAKVHGWMSSALEVKYVVLVEPGPAKRGEQQIRLGVVELATGALRCATTVTGQADPSLGTEYYEVIRKSTGQRVGTHKLDKYSMAMKTDLRAKLSGALRDKLGVKMRGFCTHTQ